MVSKLLQSILLAVLAIAPALQGVTAAPVPGSVEVDSVPIQRSAEAYSNGAPGTRKRSPSLAGDLTPVVAGINLLAQGLGAGLEQGAGDVKAAVQDAGAALDHVAGAAADATANTLPGAGVTIADAPAAALKLVEGLERGGSPISSLLNAVFGRRVAKTEQE